MQYSILFILLSSWLFIFTWNMPTNQFIKSFAILEVKGEEAKLYIQGVTDRNQRCFEQIVWELGLIHIKSKVHFGHDRCFGISPSQTS